MVVKAKSWFSTINLLITSSVHTSLRLFGKLGVWTLLMGTLVDVFVVVRSFITGYRFTTSHCFFVGILLMIFGFQFFLIGLLGEMIRYFAFQPNEEYSVRQELALRSDAHAYVPFVAGETPMRQVPPQLDFVQFTSVTNGMSKLRKSRTGY